MGESAESRCQGPAAPAALNQGDKPGEKKGTGQTTRHALADRAFVTTHKIQQAEIVKKHAPKLVQKVASGKMKLRDAAKVAKRKVIPIRKPHFIPINTAVRTFMRDFKSMATDTAKRVADSKMFFEIIAHETVSFCNKATTKKAA